MQSRVSFLLVVGFGWLPVRGCGWMPASNDSPLPRIDTSSKRITRRDTILATASTLVSSILVPPVVANAAEDDDPVQVVPPNDSKQIFNEARALESQGNIAAAQRLYGRVTKISPRFIYGWSNLGNTQVALGALDPAEDSYSQAIQLCQENLAQDTAASFGVRRCSDLYLLLLNRGSLRLNNGRKQQALEDLQQASVLRGRPDAIVAQNYARALELNGMFERADKEYNLAISMTANEVNPFWLRAALVKLQLGDVKGGYDLFQRVENRFPEAPEVRAAYATFLALKGDQIAAQRKFLEIPDRPRSKYYDQSYLNEVISWPPRALEGLSKVTTAIGNLSASPQLVS